jgi:thymidine kinase
MPETADSSFLKSLGFPSLHVHHPSNHYDFRIAQRRILVIGPMGSGKTEFSARVWRDSRVLLKKSQNVAVHTTGGPSSGPGGPDRRKVFFVRSALDQTRFPDYPDDALAYRSGYERLGDCVASIRNSFELEALLADHPDFGTWIIDETSFYEERLAYVVRQASEARGLCFIFPTLVLNFRSEIFNPTARLLLDQATDVFPLTAYCEHPDCLEDSFYTYRWYDVGGVECPAPFFDPLIIIGGDRASGDPAQPNYCTRCDKHHHLPGKEYTYLTLTALGEAWVRGEGEALVTELGLLASDPPSSLLAQSLAAGPAVGRNTLLVPFLAERALVYLAHERNLLDEASVHALVDRLNLDRKYLASRLADNGRVLKTPL